MSKKKKKSVPTIPENGPKILLIDIETAPILAFVWDLFDQNIGLNQVEKHSHILSWAAKWHDPAGKIKYPMMYADQSKAKQIDNEKVILEEIRDLLDKADIVIGHNSKRFDVKKLNARFAVHGITPPSEYRQIDTLVIAKKHFKFDSNKLEHLAVILNCTLKKMTARKFSGFDMWRECLLRNKEAWAEMKLYNCRDVDVLEEVYKKLIIWDNSINFNVYTEEGSDPVCSCGSTSFQKRGFYFSNTGKHQRYSCNSCGKPAKGKVNLFTKEKKDELKKGIK